MVKSVCKVLGLALVLCTVAGMLSPAQAADAAGQLSAIAKVMPGLDDAERPRLDRALQAEFQGVPEMPPRTFSSVQGVINAGLFEVSENTGDEDGPISDADFALVAHVARMVHQAIANGADPDFAEDLSLVGFAPPPPVITAGQIEAAAKALTRFMSTRIARDTYQEIISQALDNGWAPEVTTKVVDGLIRGADEGLDAEKLTLVLIIGVAQDLQSQGIDRVVQEAAIYVRTSKDPAYEALQRALKAGLAPPVGRELYYIAMEEEWPAEVAEGVFKGMVKGQKMGLTPEKLATALIVRVAQGLEGTSIAQAVQGEIDYVRKLEQERIDQIQSDPKLKQAYQAASQWTQLAYEPPKSQAMPPTASVGEKPISTVAVDVKPTPGAPAPAEEKPAPPKPAEEKPAPKPAEEKPAPKPAEEKPAPPKPAEKKPTPKPAEPSLEEQIAQLEPIHRAMMQQSIGDFLGTPYKWGGTAKKTGTDCSGFTQGVFRDGGIQIPRVSRIQYRKTPLKLKKREELVWGDLVFFNKNGGPDTYITHVGIYMGQDSKNPKIERFVHSCCSKGVTYSRFNKRYYLSRFVGGARPGDVKL